MVVGAGRFLNHHRRLGEEKGAARTDVPVIIHGKYARKRRNTESSWQTDTDFSVRKLSAFEMEEIGTPQK